MTRRNAADAGFASKISVVEGDFMEFSLPPDRGSVLWIGNPPYVRHHDISKRAKADFRSKSEELGMSASLLSGLHSYFLAQVAVNWRQGDFGMFVTSAEWLDVNYGEFVRELLTAKLGLRSMELYDKSERVFEDAMTTAVVFSFGSPSETVKCVERGGRERLVRREEIRSCSRWSSLFGNPSSVEAPGDLVPLGLLADVHRGVVTGNNKFWVRRPYELDGIPEEFTCPVVSHAHEIMGDCVAQKHPEKLSRLITLPESLDGLDGALADAASRIIESAREIGVDKGYVASRRRVWWSIKPPKAPAAMMTYMARKPPTFVLNTAALPMLNVVHGIYPKSEMSAGEMRGLIEYLNNGVDISLGRTYCGGLTKFEPKEAEALLVPRPKWMEGYAS